MQTSRNTEHYDALIVGARCAGAATAMLLARAGLRVLVIDWAEAGSDTISTHALMRGATCGSSSGYTKLSAMARAPVEWATSAMSAAGRSVPR